MLRPVQIAAPSEVPVSLDEAKAHLNIDHDDDDTLITSLVGAAVAHLDGYAGVLGRCLVTQQWRQDYQDWEWRHRLPFPDVSSVVVKYQDADNAEQTVDGALYEIIEDARGAMVVFRDVFTKPGLYDDRVAPVSITLTAGFGDAEDVPQALKQAILLLIGHWYENREAVTVGAFAELPMAVKALIAPYRRVSV